MSTTVRRVLPGRDRRAFVAYTEAVCDAQNATTDRNLEALDIVHTIWQAE